LSPHTPDHPHTRPQFSPLITQLIRLTHYPTTQTHHLPPALHHTTYYQEEEIEEEEEEELDEDGNPIPRPPVVYDSGEDEDLFDGRRMKSHLPLNTISKKRLSAITPWASSVGIDVHDLAVQSSSERTPTDDLTLHWVYGYNSRTTRGSVRYDSEGRFQRYCLP
jgi:hypothetical protein